MKKIGLTTSDVNINRISGLHKIRCWFSPALLFICRCSKQNRLLLFKCFCKIPDLKIQVNKNSPSVIKQMKESEGGAGENRTLVQTGKTSAFYMLSCKLIFVDAPECNLQIITYSLEFSFKR